MPCVYDNILSAVETQIEGLNLTDLGTGTAQNIVIGKVPGDWEGLLPDLPGIVICPYGATTASAYSNAHDWIGYPVLVAMLQESNKNHSSNRDRIMQWSESVRKKFINQHLSGVSSVCRCEVTTDVKFDPAAFGANLDANVIIFRFFSIEARG